VEGLEGHEDGGCPQPNVQGHGKLQHAEVNHIAQAREARHIGDERHPIAGTMEHDVFPTDGAKLSVPEMAGS
jgi:hypothetical protein